LSDHAFPLPHCSLEFLSKASTVDSAYTALGLLADLHASGACILAYVHLVHCRLALIYYMHCTAVTTGGHSHHRKQSPQLIMVTPVASVHWVYTSALPPARPSLSQSL